MSDLIDIKNIIDNINNILRNGGIDEINGLDQLENEANEIIKTVRFARVALEKKNKK